MTNKDTVDELVKANATMTKAIATLTDTNARLTKKVEAQVADLQKRQSGHRRLPSTSSKDASIAWQEP